MKSFARSVLLSALAVTTACQDREQTATAPGPDYVAATSVGLGARGPSPIGSPIMIDVELVAGGLAAPIAAVAADDGSGRLFIIDQTGVIRVVTSEGTLLPAPFLDVRDRMVALRAGFDERGLLGLAFHPDYEQNGRFFVYYSAPLRAGAPAGFDHTARIAEFRVSGHPDLADPSSERVILEVDEPQFNHNGGTLAFGPDGFLYISLGDGGRANDVGLGHVEDWYADNAGGNGQDIEQNLLGNILRIDIDAGHPYGIPADNPFVGKTGLDEIWAYGFRNPYRMSFDRLGDRLFVGDAGQGLWEEVSIVQPGGNYGWNVKEGTHCFDAENNRVSPESCPMHEPPGTLLRDPVIEYAHASQGGLGVTVIGGHLYRGEVVQDLRNLYVFGDFSRSFFPPNGTLFAASPGGRHGMWTIHELVIASSSDGRLHHYVTGFGEDERGEIHVTTRDVLGPNPATSTGRVYRLVPASAERGRGR